MVYDKILYKGDAMTSTLNDPWFKDEFHLTDNQLNQFETYYQYLVDQNQVMNLTAITEKIDVYRKHFLDSLWLLKGMPEQAKTLLDVGSGAGFPSFPIKIVKPDKSIVIVDAQKKRIDFLSRLSDKIGIDATLIHSRIEDYELKNHFDVVTARAVAKLPTLVEWCLPFVKVGGVFIAMKSIHYEEELAQSKNAISLLGGANVNVIPYDLDNETTHVLIIIEKVKETFLNYPRPLALMKKKPL